MKKHTLKNILLASTALSLICAGCGNKGSDSTTTQEKNPENTTSQTVTTEATSEAGTTEGTTSETATTETNTSTSEDWDTASTSGSLAAFEEYFNIDVSPYKKKNEQAGKTDEISYHSEVVGADRQAYVYTPYNYNPENEYPVLYLIHGIGCDGGQWVSMGAANIFDNMIANGEIAPFVAVFPSVIPAEGIDPNTLSDTNIKAFTDFVKEYETDLAPYIKANYSVSDKRENTAVCGLSMGGMEALCLGFSKLEDFNFIGSFSAAPTLDTNLLTTAGSEFTPELVLVCSGDKDSTVNDNPFNYHKKLTENDVAHIWYQHPGGGHDPNVWNLGLVNFLKRIFQP